LSPHLQQDNRQAVFLRTNPSVPLCGTENHKNQSFFEAEIGLILFKLSKRLSSVDLDRGQSLIKALVLFFSGNQKVG